MKQPSLKQPDNMRYSHRVQPACVCVLFLRASLEQQPAMKGNKIAFVPVSGIDKIAFDHSTSDLNSAVYSDGSRLELRGQ